MGPWRWPVQPGGRRWLRRVVAEGCLEGGGGGQVGGMTLSPSWRRHTAAATARSVEPTPGASHGHATLPPRALLWTATPSCRRVWTEVVLV